MVKTGKCPTWPNCSRQVDALAQVVLDCCDVMSCFQCVKKMHLFGGFIGPPAMAIDSLPDLIAASRNGLRAISLWAAAWATTTLVRIDS